MAKTEINSNKPNLAAIFATDIPCLLMGPPGVGKTAWINSEVKKMGLPMETIIASVREPADFSGLPFITSEGVSFNIPSWAQRINKTGGVVFFDEITTAPPAVQAALLRVVHEKVVGDLRLGHNVKFLAAANPAEYAANGYELSAPLANRFIHLTIKEDAKDFIENFPTYWGEPPELPGLNTEKWMGKRGLVAAYLSTRPTNLLIFPENEANRARAWPSPRTWDTTSRLLAACDSLDESIPLVVGAVGEGEGIGFFNWLKTMDLPTPQFVLKNADTFDVPKRSDKTFAILSNLIPYVKENMEKKTWDACWTVIGKICEANQPDVAAIWAIRLATDMKPEYGFPKTFIKFQHLFAGIQK
jgi:hypothetical protein